MKLTKLYIDQRGHDLDSCVIIWLPEKRSTALKIERPPKSAADTYSSMAELTSTQHQVLRVLAASSKPQRVDDIGAELNLHNNTVREVLGALRKKNLVERERSESDGRGRPHWLYHSTVSMDPQAVIQEFANFSVAVSKQMAATSTNPSATATELGRLWGRQMLGASGIPDHSSIDGEHAVRRNLDVHSAKIRVFLSRLGYEARPGADETSIELHQCPLQVPQDSKRPLLCDVHGGMIDEVVSTLSRGHLHTDVTPFAGPGYCEVKLCPAFKMTQ